LLSMDEYKKLESKNPVKAGKGRAKCLTLISTIYFRQGKLKESVALGREAMLSFPDSESENGYPGLIYNALGNSYDKMGMTDSSDYFYIKAFEIRKSTNDLLYLPSSYLKVAQIELRKGDKEQSRKYIDRAFFIADSMGNRQSQVLSLLALAKWNLATNNRQEVENNLSKAKSISANLSDKLFELKTLEQFFSLRKIEGKYEEAVRISEEIQQLKDNLADWEKERITKSLELQFEVSEKERLLEISEKEKSIVTLTNKLLWVSIGSLILIAIGIVIFLRKINKRDKLLLRAKDELVSLIEEQRIIKEKQLLNEIDFKESQIGAAAIQLGKRNKLLEELREKLGDEPKNSPVNQFINKSLNHDKEWADLNATFESANRNFYSKLKEAYPDISPNEMKICALIKMNLSIKEMSGILNISPDSVKTARYRLRKKLQLNTEDNLTDFILSLGS
jgi:DNA-binding CsgD family transcriptional regulator